MSTENNGVVSSFWWEGDTWKNELFKQAGRVETHFAETLNEDFQEDHAPLDMLERALVLTAFCIRRLIEKKLVTDSLSASKVAIVSFLATSEIRTPYHGASGGSFFRNYDFSLPVREDMGIGWFANEVIHSSQLATFTGAPDQSESGILVASDRRMRKRVLHIPMSKFRSIVDAVLNDRIGMQEDRWNPKTNEVSSIRN